MALYASRRTTPERATVLLKYLSREGRRRRARTCTWLARYLALGEPYEAELQLDHLETQQHMQDSRTKCEWYTVLCWLCSDQHARALEGAQAIAANRTHIRTERKPCTW